MWKKIKSWLTANRRELRAAGVGAAAGVGGLAFFFGEKTPASPTQTDPAQNTAVEQKEAEIALLKQQRTAGRSSPIEELDTLSNNLEVGREIEQYGRDSRELAERNRESEGLLESIRGLADSLGD